MTHARTVHPHARGDNNSFVCVVMIRSGSPPRAWGQWIEELVVCAPIRFTPTRVGTMVRQLESLRALPVHPHARGDNRTGAAWNCPHRGSPPRAWGQSPQRRPDPPAFRFTPTRVGTMVHRIHQDRFRAVHPHARGDNRFSMAQISTANGSPPRAWGQWAAWGLEERHLRFTPTRVGTMNPARASIAHLTVHPHARGDNSVDFGQLTKYTGSPPRAWGQSRSRETHP